MFVIVVVSQVIISSQLEMQKPSLAFSSDKFTYNFLFFYFYNTLSKKTWLLNHFKF